MSSRFPRTLALLLIGLPLIGLGTVPAQEVVLGQEAYATPPAPIKDFLLSDRFNNVSLRNLGPDGVHFLINESGGMTPLELMARPYVNLGETPIDHVANRSRNLIPSSRPNQNRSPNPSSWQKLNQSQSRQV